MQERRTLPESEPNYLYIGKMRQRSTLKEKNGIRTSTSEKKKEQNIFFNQLQTEGERGKALLSRPTVHLLYPSKKENRGDFRNRGGEQERAVRNL